MTINTEYLAIAVIFLGGIYIGFKVKEVFYSLAGYFNQRRNP